MGAQKTEQNGDVSERVRRQELAVFDLQRSVRGLQNLPENLVGISAGHCVQQSGHGGIGFGPWIVTLVCVCHSKRFARCGPQRPGKIISYN